MKTNKAIVEMIAANPDPAEAHSNAVRAKIQDATALLVSTLHRCGQGVIADPTTVRTNLSSAAHYLDVALFALAKLPDRRP
jgi:hypothetical protein